MSNEVKTCLVEDHRISGITDQITVGVKKGPASTSIQRYKQTSNTSSNVMFNVKIPSENILCDRAIRISTTLHTTITFTEALTDAQIINIVPASFPLNTGLYAASARINNSKVDVSSADVLEVLKKQYHQSYLSKHCPMTPNQIDQYWGNVDDAAADNMPSSYMSGVKQADIYGTSGRANSKITYLAYTSGGAPIPPNAATGVLTITAAQSLGAYIDVSVEVSEPILGLPGFELSSEEAAFLGITTIDLNLQTNDCRNCVYMELTGQNTEKKYEIRRGTKKTLSQLYFDEKSYLIMNYLSLHPSDYSKISTKNVIPYNEFTSSKSLYTRTSNAIGSAGAFSVLGNQQSLTQIPEKIFITVSAPWSERPLGVSNGLNYPITGVSIGFNNRPNLLSEMDADDLYAMSRKNGSQQTYAEFMGVVRDGNSKSYLSLGAIVVVDPVRDLSLSDFLTSGSLGSYSLQVTVKCNNYMVSVAGKTALVATAPTAELNVMCSYGSILITQQGSSLSMSSLLTKALVLDTKDNGSSIGDYEEVAKLQGGNANRSMTALGDVLRKKGKDLVKAKAAAAVDSLSAGHYNISGGSKLSKYT